VILSPLAFPGSNVRVFYNMLFSEKIYLFWTTTLFLQQQKPNIECLIVFKNLSFTKVVCVAFCFWHSLFFLGHFGHHAFFGEPMDMDSVNRN